MSRSWTAPGPQGPATPLAIAALLISLSAWCAHPSALTAQDPPVHTVVGSVTEGDGRPVLGALVQLKAIEGSWLRSTLTNEDGRFQLAAPRAGTYQLRVERLGFRAVLTDPFPVGEGRLVRREIELTGQPIPVPGVEVIVEATQRGCVLEPAEGTLVADLWEQARQAFQRVEMTDAEDSGYRFRLERYERLVEVPTARVVQERWREPATSLRSFRSPQVQELLGSGWVQRDGQGNLLYYGPDLRVLLSREFEAAHCLGLETDPTRPDEVGVRFEPVGLGDTPGIRGTLWLDRETAALEELVFHFTGHGFDPEMPAPLLELFGGEIRFRGLPDGRWMVDEWVLRVPHFRRAGRGPLRWASPEDPTLRQRMEKIRRAVERAPRTWQESVMDRRLLFREEGGALSRVETPAGAILPPRTEAALEGLVWDSLHGSGSEEARAPLAGAIVRLAGTEWEATTDRDGKFRLTVPMEGTYRVTFQHPRLDSLGVPSPEGREVRLRAGLVEEVELASPSRATLLARRCDGRLAAPNSGIVVGTVLDEALRTPVDGAEVTIRAEEGAGEEDAGEDRTRTAQAGAEGSFHFCDVPAGVWYRLTARTGEAQSPDRRLMVPASGRTVVVDPTLDRGHRGRVAGRVRQGDRGPAVADAEIHLQGPEPRTAYSDDRGRFEFERVAPGQYRIEVEHLAFRAVEAELEVPAGGAEVTVDVTLLPDAIALEPVVASVEARSPRLERAGFYERHRSGFGTFINREDIERRNAIRTSQLFTSVPRARTVSTFEGGEIVYFRGSEIFSSCSFPEVYVDGMRQSDPVIDDIYPEDIEGIEAYPSAASVPARFLGGDAACGVIAIWLRDR